jgi:putative DNA primase/helicase
MASDEFLISNSQGGKRTKAAQEQSALEYKQDLAKKELIKYDLAAEAFFNEYQTIKSFGDKFFILRNATQPGVYDKILDKTFNSELRRFLSSSTELPVCTKTKAEVIDAICDIYDASPSSTDYLAFNNGKYHKATKAFESYNEDDFYIDAFNYDYDKSNTDWGTIDRFLNQLTATPELPGGDPDFKATLIAFCYKVILQEKSWEYFLYLYGEGATGKTTFILFLESLATTYTETTLKQLNSNFGLENVWAKVLVVSPDEAKSVEDMSVLKTITSQANTVSVNRKGRPIEDLPFTGSVVMASNEPVFIGNFDGGVERRALIVPCLNEVKPQDRDYDLKDKLKKQIPAFVQYLLTLDYKDQRKALNAHAQHPRVKELTQSFKDEADSVADFASNRLELKPGHLLPSKALFQNYQLYCLENGRKPKNQLHFARGLKQIFRNEDVSSIKKGGWTNLKGLALN